MSAKKSPSVQVSDQTDLRERGGRWVVLRLAGNRSAQELTFRQAEGLARRLMKLVNLEKCRQVMDA